MPHKKTWTKKTSKQETQRPFESDYKGAISWHSDAIQEVAYF